ncbi:kinesin light chain [Polyplosphaeria fusca]|uniref:Kinesin light chain n=1 Tax=Polyplosphaeria fusca TaxID=682080 RepID=A0A9P4QSZ2_9PLEO|nr:kinesin light chain [Polyplosphaeria fusca]
MLSSESRCERVAIFGLGGVGKTQIALEFAYRLRERQPTCMVLWIPVTSIESMLEAYREIGQQLRIPGLEKEKADIQKVVHSWLSQENLGRWLLVFDNADNIHISTDEAGIRTTEPGDRINYLPKSKFGSILFTTRSRKIATQLAGKNVVSKITHLPLAIVQAAAFINENAITLAEYAVLLDDTEQNRIELLSEDFTDEGRYLDSKNPVATTWLISFEQIRKYDTLAAEYLSFMACVNGMDIPQSLLPPAESAKKAIDAIGTLVAYSFVTKHKTGQLLDLHRLVHLATRNWLRMNGTLGSWSTTALERLKEVFPDNNHTNRSLWRMYLPHVQYALAVGLGVVDTSTVELLWKFGKCAHSDGRYEVAEKALVQVTRFRSKTLGEEDPSTLNSMDYLASTYRDLGRLNEAEQLEVQVMETYKAKLGLDHPDTMTAMANLALTYGDQGRWTEAEQLEELVMETRKKKLGPNHPDTLASIDNLASTYQNQGRWKEAEQLEKQVMATSLRVLGDEHPSTLASMANLASTYQNQGQWKEAEQLNVQALEMRKRVLGEEHPSTLTSMTNLASTYRKQGLWKEAEDLDVKVLEMRKKMLGIEHPDTLTSMSNLALTFKG